MSAGALVLSALLGAHQHPTWEAFGLLEWIIVGAASVFVAWTIWLAVKYTLTPGEDADDHYKRLIFERPFGGEDDGRGEE